MYCTVSCLDVQLCNKSGSDLAVHDTCIDLYSTHTILKCSIAMGNLFVQFQGTLPTTVAKTGELAVLTLNYTCV